MRWTYFEFSVLLAVLDLQVMEQILRCLHWLWSLNKYRVVCKIWKQVMSDSIQTIRFSDEKGKDVYLCIHLNSNNNKDHWRYLLLFIHLDQEEDYTQKEATSKVVSKYFWISRLYEGLATKISKRATGNINHLGYHQQINTLHSTKPGCRKYNRVLAWRNVVSIQPRNDFEWIIDGWGNLKKSNYEDDC